MGEQVKPTEEVKQPEVRRHDVETTCCDDWCYYDDHLAFVDYHEAALASARAEVEALRKESERLDALLRRAIGCIRKWSGPVAALNASWISDKMLSDADYLARLQAAREPGRSGA